MKEGRRLGDDDEKRKRMGGNESKEREVGKGKTVRKEEWRYFHFSHPVPLISLLSNSGILITSPSPHVLSSDPSLHPSLSHSLSFSSSCV